MTGSAARVEQGPEEDEHRREANGANEQLSFEHLHNECGDVTAEAAEEAGWSL